MNQPAIDVQVLEHNYRLLSERIAQAAQRAGRQK